MPRARKPEPTLHEVLNDQFSGRDASLVKLMQMISSLDTRLRKQARDIVQLESSQRELEKRLRDLEPVPDSGEPPVRRTSRIDFVFEDAD